MRGSRRWAVAAAVGVTLLAGGCGSGDDTPEDGADSSSSSKSGGKDASEGPDDGDTQGASSSGGSGGGESSGGSSSGGGSEKNADVSRYQGTWSTDRAGSGDELLIMNIHQTSVSLIGDGIACQGRLKAAGKTAGKPANIDLTCKNGSKKYAAGSITEVAGKQLTVEWASDRTTRFTEGAKMTAQPGEEAN